ncbi:uncharacterized protein MEPE_05068 [Melanopsichium pennsylvanicum]|uniref:Ras GEF n=2 Tax=Melanopsichium pennsylvanicum TaxID=63383 RepID=A0AAJ4XPZ4_9BASI|nr:ras gef [Melanopsichium pennsylvanicum 4]SNX86359.1 uncharacterized protein MEPE_05068 [Melanopsichium pennsylvanicum]
MSASSSRGAAATAAPLDVETTNWNAVKILAAQHHIPLNLLEATRDAVSSQFAQYPDHHDYGAQTPLHITAVRLDTGRVVFRFRSRHLVSATASGIGSLGTATQHNGMPRSSSSGTNFTPLSSDAVDSPQQSNLSGSLFRRTGNLSLKHSRSIPVLRRKASSTLIPAFSHVEAGASGSTAHAPLAFGAGNALEDPHPCAPTMPFALSSQMRSTQHAAGTHLNSYHTGVMTSASMARTGSSPVNGLHANRYGANHIQEGDVLGAVLGLGQSELWARSHSERYAVAPQQSQGRRSSGSSSDQSLNTSKHLLPAPEIRLPEFSFDSQFDKSPRFHQLREAQSFGSNASDTTARGEDEDSVDKLRVDLQPFLSRLDQQTSEFEAQTLIFDVIQSYQRPSVASSLLGSNTLKQQQCQRTDSRNLLSAKSPAVEGSDFMAQAHALPTSAAPGDDPRFAIWAVKSDKRDGAFVVSNRAGQTDADQTLASEFASSSSSSPASATKRRNRSDDNGSGNRSSGIFQSSSPASEKKPDVSGGDPPPRKAMLFAASAARLVAELTAEIDVTLRSDFFYTYRQFMTSFDLLELLILRFEWAVSEPSSAEDEARRRIVRVRTYVVIKHWLQHHFDFDFLPNRTLRQRLAMWLNVLAKDQRITDRPADLNIVNSLRKIVRGLKETYSHSGVGALLLHDSGRLTDSPSGGRKTDSLSTLDYSSHDSEPRIGMSASSASSGPEHKMMKSGSALSLIEDVNLDFSEDQSSHDPPHFRSPPAQHSHTASPGDATRAAQKAAEESVLVSHRHTIAPIPVHQPRPASAGIGNSPAPLPNLSNAWSRAFVQTVGRLSKFKRVLGNRGLGLDSNNELNTEAEECSDLLFVKGGLDSLLQYFATVEARRQLSSQVRWTGMPLQRPLSLTEEANEDEEEGPTSQTSEDSAEQEETPSLAGASTNRSTPASSIDLTLNDKRPSQGEPGPQGLGISQQTQDDGEYSVATQGPELFDLDPSSLRSLHSLTRPKAKGEDHLHHATSEQTLRSVSRAPTGRSLEDESDVRSFVMRDGLHRKQQRTSVRDPILSNGAPRVVQIDDIDLSSDDDDFAVRKALRRLPGARDLRQANTVKDLEAQQLHPGRESVDTIASSMFRHPASACHLHIGSFAMGHSRAVSVDSAMFVQEAMAPCFPAAPMISTVQSEMLDPDEALQGYELVKGFRLDDVESDDEEPGDVEAALRRLEGIIDEDRQKKKAKRVERLWQRSLARNSRTDAADGEEDKRMSQASSCSRADRALSPSLTGSSLAEAEDEAYASAHPCDRSIDDHPSAQPKSPIRQHQQSSFLDLRDLISASESGDHDEDKPALDGAMVRAEPLAAVKRVPSVECADATASAPAQKTFAAETGPRCGASAVLSPARGLAPLPPVHRSFLLSYRSEVVVRQMCLIEAELLRSVTWDELASSRWRERRFGAEVTDWEAFYRDRVRDRLEAQRLGEMPQERTVEAIVTRFNLTSNWVASEVVLTQNVDERAAVISKLIRIAWKCYLQSNFASLAQIIFGLSTPWVERLRRTWNRVGYFEMRMWRDLNSFVGPRHNFKHLRNAMLQLAEAGGDGDGESNKGGKTQGCIPFFGLFVSDLMQYDAMPTFLDPTAPTMPASTFIAHDGKTRLHPANPNAFNNLEPLPPAVQLEPLINVLKFRSIADVIRHIGSFQNTAKRYGAMFEADKGAYVRCLKLRCLPGELLARLGHVIEP